MSQRKEKLNRKMLPRLDKLEGEVERLRQAQMNSDRFTATIHTIQTQTATEEEKLRRGIAGRCREAEHLASQWRLNAYLTLAAFVLLATICLVISVKAAVVPDKPAEIAAQPVSVIQMPEESEDFENEKIDRALKSKAINVGECRVTFYTCCAEECGNDLGITASGIQATPEVSVAVDPEVIPLGCDVLIQWQDGTEQWCRSDDTGSAIKGNRIDLCVSDRTDAFNRGVTTATVYYVPVE